MTRTREIKGKGKKKEKKTTTVAYGIIPKFTFNQTDDFLKYHNL
jgi:hypothetical protein